MGCVGCMDDEMGSANANYCKSSFYFPTCFPFVSLFSSFPAVSRSRIRLLSLYLSFVSKLSYLLAALEIGLYEEYTYTKELEEMGSLSLYVRAILS